MEEDGSNDVKKVELLLIMKKFKDSQEIIASRLFKLNLKVKYMKLLITKKLKL